MFMLSDQQRAISDAATRFGAEHLAPLALQWEQDRHFPVQVLREAGRLKMGGLHVGPDVGGQALSRVDAAALVVEGVATGCPAIASCLSNHNTAAWMIDTYGDRDQRYRWWLPGLCALTNLAVYCVGKRARDQTSRASEPPRHTTATTMSSVESPAHYQ
jgi:alkylation response protein AidB-like acyl-CoA dehydrogenase